MNDKPNHKNEQELKALLRKEFPSLKSAELQRDLWPQMLRRFEAQPLRIPWFDWALAAVVVATILFLPGTIPALLYHL